MEKLERLPSWLRWLLTPITVVISFIIIGVISQGLVWFQSKMLGLGDDAWLEKIWFNILAPAVTGYFTIMAGVLVAPAHKKIVSLVCGALIVMLGGISLLSLLGRGDWWGILNVIATVSGIGGAIYTTFDDVSN
jgi:uncharacterized membrane protein